MRRHFSLFWNKLLRRRLRNDISNNFSDLSTDKIEALEKILGISLDNKSYYIKALTHRSYLENNNANGGSNERLEFLGDSVLGLLVAQYLFENFPDENEGFLTKIRAKIVNRNSLWAAADELGLSKIIIIGNNLQRDLVKKTKTVLADALEALIGAIYLDHDLETCRIFIYKNLIRPHMIHDEYLIDENYKSQLLEYTQANKISSPVYEILEEEGPQHNRIFTIRVIIGEKNMGDGIARNKKTAEQNAARIALIEIRNSESSL